MMQDRGNWGRGGVGERSGWGLLEYTNCGFWFGQRDGDLMLRLANMFACSLDTRDGLKSLPACEILHLHKSVNKASIA